MVLRNADLFDRTADANPDRVAVIEGDTKFTYRDVQAFTHRFAAALYANGFKRQECVALYSPNHFAVLLCLLGMWRAGGTWVPVNTRNAMDANIAYMNYVRVRWLFYHSQYADDVRKLMAAVPTIRHVICIDKADNGHTVARRLPRTRATARIGADKVDCFGNLDELVGIFPTGGTTGPAKGACVTNLGWGTMMEITANAWRVPGLAHPGLPGHRAADPCGGAGVDRGVRRSAPPTSSCRASMPRRCSRTSRRTRSRICICRRPRCTSCSIIPTSASTTIPA